MKRIPVPEEKEWREIWYHPSDIITRVDYRGDKYWKELIPGCRMEFIEEDLGFMKNLVRDVKVRIIYPEGWQDMYVEPLAKIHNKFWDAMSEVTYEVYPFSHRNMKKFHLGGAVHSFVAEFYWNNLDYKQFTPDTWVEKLNSILDFIEKNGIKKEDDLPKLKELFLSSFQ